ncbi:MAG: insulinase family protein [Ignavibacteriaceae bacterium]|nr:insulinase family protein [Ignavibacteriaceae bacterium]
MINRKQKPEPAGELFFSLPEIQETTLSNGLKVVYIQKEKLPITRLNLMIECGSKFDPINKKGLSNLTSMVIDEGADGLSAVEISDVFDMLGSNFSVSSGAESINLKLQTLTENLEGSLDIFSKVLLKPDFKQQDFEREKRKISTRLLQLGDEPEFLAERIFEFLLFGENNPYSFPSLGYVDNIENLQLNDIKKFYSDKFSPKVSNLVAVGNSDFVSFTKVMVQYFKDWDLPTERTVLSDDDSINSKNIFLFDKKDSVQSEIRIGHPSVKRNSYSFFPRLILNTILGGQFTSRINLNLRENKGYTYGVFSTFSYLKDAAYFYVSTSVGIENTLNAVNEIYFELEKIQSGVTDEELEFAKSSIIKKFPSNFESYRQITGNLTTKIIHSLPDNYFNTYIENVSAVNSDQVKEAAQNLIHPEEAFCVIVGDKNKLYSQLKDTGLKIVEVDYKGREI